MPEKPHRLIKVDGMRINLPHEKIQAGLMRNIDWPKTQKGKKKAIVEDYQFPFQNLHSSPTLTIG